MSGPEAVPPPAGRREAPTSQQLWAVRQATSADVVAVARFQTDCWREAYRGLVPADYLDRVTTQDRELRWRHRIESGGRTVLVAWQGLVVLGVASTADHREEPGLPPLELKSLYVGAAARGTGLAQDLIAAALQDRPAFLWVFTANLRAQAFYRRQGFHADGHAEVDDDTGLAELRMLRTGG